MGLSQSLTQQLKDYLVILVEETFIRLIYHVDEMIEKLSKALEE